MKPFLLAGAFATTALAAAGPWEQCGGQGWSGDTTCVSGYQCSVVNDWYSQCTPGGGSPTAGNPSPTTPSTPSSTSSPAKKFRWFGINQSCAEFGQGIFPGLWGKEFTFPSTSAMQTLMNDGYNTFRVAFSMERLVPDELSGDFDEGYLRNLTETVDFITGAGHYAVLDPHNFGRYYDEIITDVAAFRAFWANLGAHFGGNARVVFDTNNEYHDMDQDLVLQLNQAAIDGVRGAGATEQWIFVEGNSWTGAWTWNVTNDNLKALSDPQDRIVYEMHQYLDSDGSGTHEECVSAQIGAQRVVGATEWLRENGKVGVLGEFGGGANDVCSGAIEGLLQHLQENSDVWAGALWWAAGPWWGDYFMSFEPPSGIAYTYYNSLLKQFTV
ncbi:hypothetical protein VTK26DRAFT_8389 [Humicola hyalothermophila]